MGSTSRVLPGTPVLRRLVGGGVLVAVAALLLAPTARGIDVENVTGGHDGGLPVRVYVPRGSQDAPGVVVAHGFAGSAALMHTWSLALAHAGFVVVAPDLPGHGTSTVALADAEGGLPGAVSTALAHLRGLEAVDPDRVALLGHSMGSGAVLSAGIAEARGVRAVVAVSPTDAAVTPTAPADLLLLVGEREPRFVANAESLLERAGGIVGVAGDGTARDLVIVPQVEHVSILFARTAHEASIGWLSSALGHTPSGRAPAGPLAGWAVLVAGLVLLWQAFVLQSATAAPRPTLRSSPLLALPTGGVAATASLVILERSVALEGLLGLQVAGMVGLWFLMAGAAWLRFGLRPAAPEARDIGWALLVTMALVGTGATSTLAWAPWWLSGSRVAAAAALAVLLLPFSLAAATLLVGRRGWRAAGAWAVTSVSVLVTLGAAAVVVPGLTFLVLILPVLPAVLGLVVAVSIGVDRPWATGTAGAVFLGWLLAMLFPLA